MRFANPIFLYSLLIIAGLIAFYIREKKSRRQAEEKFAQRELLKELLAYVDFSKRRLKKNLIILAVVFILLALIRPQWGFRWEDVRRRGVDILIAVDTSKSMLTEDVKPNRLERSKLAIKDLVKKLQGDRIGLIAFSGSAFLQCPLTVDYSGFLLTLENLDIDTIPKGGSSISSAIEEAMSSYGDGLKKYKALIIITDGEDHEGNPVKLAEEAKKKGIIIHCIGIGTKSGDLIPITASAGGVSFLKDKDGNVVKSRLGEELLQRIALESGGSYIHSSSTEFGLDLLYDEKISKMEKQESEERMAKQYHERFQIPLVIALLLLMIEPLINDRKNER